MSSPFDQFAKDVLDLPLSAHGRVETEVEAPALKSQRADVMFEPDPAHDAARRALGLVGEMTARCCLFDPFHEAPDVPQVRGCLRKLLNHQHARSLGHGHRYFNRACPWHEIARVYREPITRASRRHGAVENSGCARGRARWLAAVVVNSGGGRG